MVAVAPFDGLLYDQKVVGDLASVTSPPYDVVLPHEQDRLHRASKWNIALVDLGADVAGGPEATQTALREIGRAWWGDRGVYAE